jgi:hypothetical protein
MACFAFFVPCRGVGVRDRWLVGIREEQLLVFDAMGAKSILPSIDNNGSMKPAPCSRPRAFLASWGSPPTD